jgi:RNA polymerase sigma factor (sigma-70 family)
VALETLRAVFGIFIVRAGDENSLTNRACAALIVVCGSRVRDHEMGGNGMPTTNTGQADVAAAIVAWQETGDDRRLEFLVATTMAELGHVAAVSLRKHGIHDRSAVDDALALVFDHLRRLPGPAPGEHTVARFDAARPQGTTRGDPGRAYLAWLVRERSLDVARQRRRLAKRWLSLSEHAMSRLRFVDAHDGYEDSHEREARFDAALQRLEPRLRTVVQMLLAGKSQAAIAHVLDVCDGTVSRMRTRAIAELRRMME